MINSFREFWRHPRLECRFDDRVRLLLTDYRVQVASFGDIRAGYEPKYQQNTSAHNAIQALIGSKQLEHRPLNIDTEQTPSLDL